MYESFDFVHADGSKVKLNDALAKVSVQGLIF